MAKVFYWRGILGNHDLLTTHTKVIEAIQAGHYQGLNLEKLRGHQVYSARIDRKDRLLFTTVLIDNQSYLLLLGEVLNHDYDKSKYLDPIVLKNFLDRGAQAITALVQASDFEQTEAPVLFAQEEGVEFAPLDYFNHKFFAFNSEQEQVLTTQLPVVVSGAPGSGKSSSALSMLIQYMEQWDESVELPRVLYLTSSTAMVDNIKTAWNQVPASQGVGDEFVVFKTYRQLLLERAQVAPEAIVGKTHYHDWIGEYERQHQRKLKAKASSSSIDFSEQYDLIYQEFRIISGCNEPEDYLLLGERQSNIQDLEQRTWILKAYEAYLALLKDQALVNPDFYPLPTSADYDLVLIDESQNVSRLMLKQLYGLAKNEQICYFIDTHQSLLGGTSTRSYLKDKLGIARAIELPCSYRCPANVIQLANEVIRLKRRIAGGKSDKNEYIELNLSDEQKKNAGNVYWFDSRSPSDADVLQNHAHGEQFAIVTKEKLKDEAASRFNTPLVFTPQEIIGLEFQTIIVYHLLEQDSFYEANKILATLPADKEIRHRAKQGAGNETFNASFNQLFITLTRTMNTLIIYQEKKRALEYITTPLSAVKTEPGPAEPGSVSTPPSAVNWQTIFDTLMEREQFSQAKGVYIDKLGQTELAFQKLMATRLPGDAVLTPSLTKTTSEPPRKKGRKGKALPPAPKPTSSTPTAIEAKKFEENKKIARRLVAKLNDTTIRSLLKKNNCMELLFQPLLDDHTCVFYRIMRLHDARGQLRRHLKTLWQRLEVYGLDQVDVESGTPLFWIVTTPLGEELLIEELKNNRKLLAQITIEALIRTFTFDTNNKNTSPMFFMASGSRGREFLTTLLLPLLDSPPISTELVKALCLAPGQGGGSIQNKTIIQLLATDLDGHELLTRLLMAMIEAELFTSEVVTALCKALTVHSGPQENATALLWLSGVPTGRNILSLVFKTMIEKRLLSSELIDALCLPQTNKAGVNYKVSALYWLAGTEAGRKLLHILIPDIIKAGLLNAKFVKALCLPVPAIAGIFENVTPLYFLAGAQESRELLTILIPALIEADLVLPCLVSALCLPRTNKSGFNRNATAILWLAGSTEGCELLTLLTHVIIQKGLLTREFVKALALRQKVNSNFGESSALYWLAGNPQGRILLHSILPVAFNERLITLEFLDAFYMPRNTIAGSDKNLTALYFLAANIDGHLLVDLFFQEILKAGPIPIDLLNVLCLKNTDNIHSKETTSIIFWLILGSKFNILSLILEHSPDFFVSDAFIETLFESFPPINESLFSTLIQSEQGRAFISQLFTIHPSLTNHLTTEFLSREIKQFGYGTKVCTILNYLVATPDSRILFKQMLLNNPALREIPFNLLTKYTLGDMNGFSPPLTELLNAPREETKEILDYLSADKKVKQYIESQNMIDTFVKSGFSLFSPSKMTKPVYSKPPVRSP